MTTAQVDRAHDPVQMNPLIARSYDKPEVAPAELPEELAKTNDKAKDVENATRTAAADNNTGDPFQLSSQYAYTPRKMRVFTIGAGFSGVIMAHKFQHRFPAMRDIVQNTIFESRSDVGGTWLANHYPGVQCDVPAHIYVSLGFFVLCRGPTSRANQSTDERHSLSIRTRSGSGSTPADLIYWRISSRR